VPQGVGADLIATMEGFSRETSMPSRWNRRSAPPPRAPKGRFAGSVVPVKDWLGQTILDEDEFIKPRTTMEGLASLKPAFEQMGAMGFDAVALQRTRRWSASSTCTTPAIRRASWMAPRRS
jgi:acetyl-CoA C-acetyltransferase